MLKSFFIVFIVSSVIFSQTYSVGDQISYADQLQEFNIIPGETSWDWENFSLSQLNAATRTVVVVNIPIVDENQDGFDDEAFVAVAQSGDTNQDGTLNVIDIILNGE